MQPLLRMGTNHQRPSVRGLGGVFRRRFRDALPSAIILRPIAVRAALSASRLSAGTAPSRPSTIMSYDAAVAVLRGMQRHLWMG